MPSTTTVQVAEQTHDHLTAIRDSHNHSSLDSVIRDLIHRADGIDTESTTTEPEP